MVPPVEKTPQGVRRETGVKPKVLIIESDEATREFCDCLLRDNYAVTLAFDGDDGIKKFRIGGPFDVVIMERTFPGGMQGNQVIKEMRAMNPNQGIIMCASGAKDMDPDDKKAIGANYYFNKPFDREVFMEAVRELIRYRV